MLVGVADAARGASADTPLLTRLPLLPQQQLIDLLRRARIVVSNGGDTLLQALACGSACVAVPIARDQAARIARCSELRLIRSAPLDTGSIVATVAALHADEEERAALASRAREAGVHDALPLILDWMAALLITELRT